MGLCTGAHRPTDLHNLEETLDANRRISTKSVLIHTAKTKMNVFFSLWTHAHICRQIVSKLSPAQAVGFHTWQWWNAKLCKSSWDFDFFFSVVLLHEGILWAYPLTRAIYLEIRRGCWNSNSDHVRHTAYKNGKRRLKISFPIWFACFSSDLPTSEQQVGVSQTICWSRLLGQHTRWWLKQFKIIAE